MSKAYSYLRFSTLEQRKGHSAKRQADKAAAYAEKHGLILDTSLTFHDIGKSGYTGAHMAAGKLGEFLAAVKEGVIKPGEFLLIENLDRLSRQAVNTACNLLQEIISKGITVVTLDDEKVYDQTTLQDTVTLLTAIIFFSRAHEESLRKGERVGAAWKAKREKAQNQPLTSQVPGWITYNKEAGKLELIPDRVEILKDIFRMYIDGKGHAGIAAELNRRNIEPWGKGGRKASMWHSTYIKKILVNDAVIGVFRPHTLERTEDKKVRVPKGIVEGYYPAAIDTETFNRAVEIARNKQGIAGRKATKEVKNIFSMLAKCASCDIMMVRVNKGNGCEYLVCQAVKYKTKFITGLLMCNETYKDYKMPELTELFCDAVLSGAFAIPGASETLNAVQAEIAKVQAAINENKKSLVELNQLVRHGELKNSDILEHNKIIAIYDGTNTYKEIDWTVSDEKKDLQEKNEKLEKELASLRIQADTLRPAMLDIKMAQLREAVMAGDYEKANGALRALCGKVVVSRESMVFHFHHTTEVVTLCRKSLNAKTAMS